MRNKIIITMAAAGIMMYGASAFAADTVDHTAGPFGSGKVTFIGVITNSPCDIAPGDDDLTVKFGQISYRKLEAAHATDVADTKPVTIHLQNCSFDVAASSGGSEPMSMVHVNFTGTTTAGGGDIAYPNSIGGSMATGVGVKLLASDGTTVLKPSELASKGTSLQKLATGDNQIQLFAQLVNLGDADTVKPGNINIPLTYTLTYK
ncbi:fimbrial protein [Salmonella enterica]|nr:fimbrial protein [Salmonella enterica]